MKIPLLFIFAISSLMISATDFSISQSTPSTSPSAADLPDSASIERILAAELKKNAPYTPAADFEFIDRFGTGQRLYDHVDGRAEILLVFFDPDCDDCRQLADSLRSDTATSRRVSAGDLRIIMITPFSVDPSAWHAYAATLPPQWIVGFSPDGRLDDEALYFLPAIPSLYHLSPSALVLSRTAPLP